MPLVRQLAASVGLAALAQHTAGQFIGGGFTNPACDFTSFAARAAEVTTACCEGKGDEVCPLQNGLPGTPVACDLECALSYVRFFVSRAAHAIPTAT